MNAADLPPVLVCPCCQQPIPNDQVWTAAMAIHARIITAQQQASRPTRGKRVKKPDTADTL